MPLSKKTAKESLGIVILATIVQGIGVPAEGIALILGVDRLLDMTRTAVNVSGDLTACIVMDRWVGGRELVDATESGGSVRIES
jgi:Na+/H+-dicarboxylate symporter